MCTPVGEPPEVRRLPEMRCSRQRQRRARVTSRNDMAHRPVIAIVEDDAAVRGALSSLMRSVGYQVKMYVSAEDFLDSDPANAFECVVVDIQLPRASGLDLAKALRR